MRILHSADWQLGCAFRSFGPRADALRACRLATLERALKLARRDPVDAFVVAGDLFEDNQVAPGILAEVCRLFASVPDLRIFLLPGNHDPISGPGCIWLRPPFSAPPPNVTVIREPGVFPVAEGYLVANPLRQKLSPHDPSVLLGELAAQLPPDAIRVGVTHGALAIEGKHQPNDHPIHVQAATRARLDYLALGHWHQWQSFDQGRILMPGTPEPDAFDHAEGRFVAWVEVSRPSPAPQVRSMEVAALTWRELTLDFSEGAAAWNSLEHSLRKLEPVAKTSVIRVTLTGAAQRGELHRAVSWLEPVLKPFAAAELRDQSTLALSAAELQALSQGHPILAQVLSDMAQVRQFATGQAALGDGTPGRLTFPEFQQIARELELEIGSLDESFFKTASDLLASRMQEASA